MKPRSYFTERPICEAIVPMQHLHRTYQSREAMRPYWQWPEYGAASASHPDTGYCLDRPEPATGSHVKDDYIFGR
jgi:hypothetical protein